MNVPTPCRSEADFIAAKTEELLAEIGSMRSGLLTVDELAWVTAFRTKLRWGTSAGREAEFYYALLELRDELKTRT